jgi:hypothetical protein
MKSDTTPKFAIICMKCGGKSSVEMDEDENSDGDMLICGHHFECSECDNRGYDHDCA